MSTYKFTNKDMKVIEKVKNLWKKIGIYNNKYVNSRINNSTSGFTKNNNINQLYLTGFNEFFIKYKIYTEDKKKEFHIKY